MAPNLTIHFWNANDINGTPVLEITDEDPYFRGFHITPDLFALGGWELELARKVGFALFDSGAVQPEVFVRFLVHAWSDTDYYFGGLLQKRNQVVVHRQEQGEEVFTFGGPGPKAYLDRYRLGIEQLTGTGWNLDLENGVWRWNETATAGRVLNRVIAEDAAQADPALPDLTKTFGDANDSDAVAWTNDVAGAGEYEIPIGQSLLETIWELEDLSDLYTVVNLGSVGAPLYQLEAFQAYGSDVTGTSPGAGVGLIREGLNIANDALTVEGVGIRKATHVIVEGKDGAWATAVGTAWSSGEYIKWAKISYPRSSNVAILERAGLRWIRRQDNGDRQLTVEIVPGADESAGLDFPGPGETLWLGNTVTLDTAEDGSTHTPLDFTNEDQLLTGLDLELGPAGDTTDADAKAKSWDVTLRLNWERGGFPAAPNQSTTGTIPSRGIQLCASIACDDVDESAVPSVTVTNGDAENGSGTQWSGGAYTTSKKHAGSRAYEDAGVATGDLLYTFSGVTFLAGTRYLFDFWRRLTIDHDRTTVTVGDVAGDDTESRVYQGAVGADPTDLWLESAVGADGATWNRGRICWTPSADTTAVTFRFVSESFSSGDHAIDDLRAYVAPLGDELIGNDSRAARCDHGHLAESLRTEETDTSKRLAPDGSGGVSWEAGSGGAPTTADYLVGTAQGGLSAEIVVGTTPGGELGGTWASPTVDATHSGSAHHNENHASRHADAGADALDITDLDGFTGNSSQVLLGDATFGPAPTAGAGDFSGLTKEGRIQGVSDYVAGYDASAADERGFPVGMLGLSRGHSIWQSDCFLPEASAVGNAAVVAESMVVLAQGNGANVSNQASVAGHIGIIRCPTGTSATGRCGIGSEGLMAILGGGKVRFLSIFRLNALSTSSERFGVVCGVGNAAGSVAQSNGVTFRYTDNVNSGKWQAVCNSSVTGLETAVDTGVAADTGWHSFEFEVNAAAGSVEFFIDGASVATITTDIPAAGMRQLAVNIIKSVGITSRTVDIDAYRFVYEYTTSR